MQILDNLQIASHNPRATPKPWVAGSNPPAPVKIASEAVASEAIFLLFLCVSSETGFVSNHDKSFVASVPQHAISKKIRRFSSSLEPVKTRISGRKP